MARPQDPRGHLTRSWQNPPSVFSRESDIPRGALLDKDVGAEVVKDLTV